MLQRTVQATVLFSLLLLLLYWGKSLLMPFSFSLLLTFLLLPVSERLQRWRIPKVVAILLSIFLALALLLLLVYVIYLQMLSFATDIPANWIRLSDKINVIHVFIVDHFNVSKREQVNWLGTKSKDYADALGSLLLSVFSATGEFLTMLTLIPIYVFFLTLYKDKVKMFVRMVFAEANPNAKMELIGKVVKVSQKYLKGILLDILILSILNSVGFLLLDLEHAWLFGILAAVLNIIPYIGVMIGSILPIVMALITKDSLGYAIGVAAVCTFVQVLDNNIISPYVIGTSVSVNSLTAMIALVLSALIWGIPGMILALPLTGMLKVLCDHIPTLKPYGFLIGDELKPLN